MLDLSEVYDRLKTEEDLKKDIKAFEMEQRKKVERIINVGLKGLILTNRGGTNDSYNLYEKTEDRSAPKCIKRGRADREYSIKLAQDVLGHNNFEIGDLQEEIILGSRFQVNGRYLTCVNVSQELWNEFNIRKHRYKFNPTFKYGAEWLSRVYALGFTTGTMRIEQNGVGTIIDKLIGTKTNRDIWVMHRYKNNCVFGGDITSDYIDNINSVETMENYKG